jgi:hypothetical protein
LQNTVARRPRTAPSHGKDLSQMLPMCHAYNYLLRSPLACWQSNPVRRCRIRGAILPSGRRHFAGASTGSDSGRRRSNDIVMLDCHAPRRCWRDFLLGTQTGPGSSWPRMHRIQAARRHEIGLPRNLCYQSTWEQLLLRHWCNSRRLLCLSIVGPYGRLIGPSMMLTRPLTISAAGLVIIHL